MMLHSRWGFGIFTFGKCLMEARHYELRPPFNKREGKMITQQTVFILGAGASAPYGYPTGAGLKDIICDEINELFELLIPRSEIVHKSYEEDHKKAIEENSVAFIKRFCESPIDLIDSFLARNHDLSQIGKTLIALCILNAERKSRFLREIIAEERIYDWYGLLFNIMVEELKDEDGYLDFKNNRVDFITFNYDRSLEYFLYDKLKTTYGSIDLIKNRPVDLIPFRFIHVYGKIDNFEWEDPPGLAYKSEYYIRDILRVGGNIKLIHERDNEFLDDIKKTIAKASKIFFLGFGYDEDNMRALSWPENFNEDKRILGTAFNLPQSRIKEIRAMIQKGFKNPGLGSVYPIIKLLDCRSLLDEYRNLLNE